MELLAEQGGEVVETARPGLALARLLDRALALAERAPGGVAGLRAPGFAERLEAALVTFDVADRRLTMVAERGRELLALGGPCKLGQRVAGLLLGVRKVVHRVLQDVFRIREGHGGTCVGCGVKPTCGR